MAEYYITQERAFAPGIAGEWPKIIPKPDSPHGRLVKAEGLKELLEELADKFETEPGQETSKKIRIFL